VCLLRTTKGREDLCLPHRVIGSRELLCHREAQRRDSRRHGRGVGEVDLRKPRPRPAMLMTFGPRTTSVSRGNLRGTGVNRNANTAHVT
jgi:hypothetical protein